jgi:hypothetical protein
MGSNIARVSGGLVRPVLRFFGLLAIVSLDAQLLLIQLPSI